jgi:hypothetical protein
VRADGGVADGDGGFYWLMASVLPWFQSFRYPGKLLTFTTAAVAALAGIGWDRWRQGHPARAPAALLVLSLAALAGLFLSSDRLIRLFRAQGQDLSTVFGPFDSHGAVSDLRRALGQGAIVMSSAVVLAAAVKRRQWWSGPAALVVLTTDLAVANAELVISVPQAMFDKSPQLVRLIEESEKRDPSPGPFRVHRMPIWSPGYMSRINAEDRYVQVTRWEYDTIKPKYGLLGGLSYTVTPGSLELKDYDSFFGGFYVLLDTRRTPLRGAQHHQRILYYTRRGYDLWNTRYFVLPMDPGGWQSGSRGFASFLDRGEILAPPPSLTSHLENPENRERLRTWTENEDWQLVRNKDAYPRAWVVHRARFLEPIEGMAKKRERERIMEQILFADDAFWFYPGRRVFDPHALAWIETDDPRSLAHYVPGAEPDPTETVSITRYEPQRVEIEARLKSPGLVILADVYYPGWHLTIDGRASTILRANRLMRGAPVGAGTHRLVYTYSPSSFRLGGLVTLTSLGIGLTLAIRLWRTSA